MGGFEPPAKTNVMCHNMLPTKGAGWILARSKVAAVSPAATCPLLSHLLAKHNHVSLSLSLSQPIPSLFALGDKLDWLRCDIFSG